VATAADFNKQERSPDSEAGAGSRGVTRDDLDGNRHQLSPQRRDF